MYRQGLEKNHKNFMLKTRFVFAEACKKVYVAYLRKLVYVCTVISRLSSHPFKFASRLSSQKIFKKSRFNFNKNLLIFAANQTSHKNIHNLNKS